MTISTLISDQVPAIRTCPEKEILLCCSQTSLDSETVERLKTLLQKNIDWESLINTAIRQGVMPLLYWNLSQTCPEAVPDIALAQLKTNFEANAGSNLFLTGELLKVLKLFATYKIPAIPFKGAVLAASAYGNLVFRQFSDLDILIHPKNIQKAKQLLTFDGYKLISELSWQSQWISRDGRVTVDLHQAITPKDFPVSFNFERLSERLAPVSLAGSTVLGLSSMDTLLVLCTNVARDCWQERERLAQICDISELLRVHPEMNWERLLEEANRQGCKRMLLLGLLLASDLLGAAIPEKVSQKIQTEPMVKSLAVQVYEWLFCNADGSSRGMKKKLFYFKVRERLQDKMPYLMHLAYLLIAPSQVDRAFFPLHDSLSFLYYLVRPTRIIGESGLRLLQHFNKVLNLLSRRMRARKLGIEFNRAADFQLPQKIRVREKYQPISFPSEKGMAGEFIEVLLDDCYGLEKIPQPISKILDIGAHVGLFSVAARNIFPKAIIHAYEPNPLMEKYLKNQARIANSEYFMEAVGAEHGKVLLNCVQESNRIRSQVDEMGNIPMVALHQAIERLGGSVDLVKLDCEGAEWLIFKDQKAWQSIKNLTMEYHLWPSHTEDEIRYTLQNILGFTITHHTSRSRWQGLIHASRTS